MNAEVIAVGTELLLGCVVNTDTVYLGRKLAELGIGCYHQVTVGDNPERLEQAIRTALGRADLVITCGGLGPTVDDITLETLSRATGRPLKLNRAILRKIQDKFARLKIRMPKANARQAMVPLGAVVFPPTTGTAPGFLLRVPRIGDGPFRDSLSTRGGGHSFQECPPMDRPRFLAALPGPPKEMVPMAEKNLIPRLRRMSGGAVILSRTLHMTGLTESEADAKVRDLLALEGAVTVGIYAHPGHVELRVTARAPGAAGARRLIAGVERKIRKRLGSFLYGADDDTLEGAVGALLRRRRRTLAVAESCTGGLLAHRLTDVPGSSDYFRGGVVAYANDVKQVILSVPPGFLKKYGAVSGPVAAAMAEGARLRTAATLGVGITGIAGPGGGSRKKPVGLVYMALSTPQRTLVQKRQFSGDRQVVKLKATQAALDLLRKELSSSRKRGSDSRIRGNDRR